MKRILFAWIGENDLRSAEADGANGLGAICQTITNRQFDEIVLLSDYPEERTAGYMKWLELRKVQNARFVKVDLGGNPTDYRAIYENAKFQVQSHLDSSSSKPQLSFQISSGTPAMQTVWIILANSHFNAKLLQSSLQQGVKDVDFPFEIAADYLPELLKKNEKKIYALFNDNSATPAGFKEIVHHSVAMKNLIQRARIVAPYPVPVLIQGESGTGKELLAKAIHTTSLRKGKFVAINCGAIPEELFESELFGHKKGSFTGATVDKTGYIEVAAGGTLFLDEIGEMPLKIQVKLLRVLQEGTFARVGDSFERKADIRIISATNRNLIDELAVGTFRDDMFHRLAVAILSVPPLREREGDIGLLVNHLLDAANKKLSTNNEYKAKSISASAQSLLMKHTWSGNVRELQNTLLRAAVWSQSDIIDKESIEDAMLPMSRRTATCEGVLDKPLEGGFDLEVVLAKVARHYLERAMKESGGNKTKAAKMLNFKSYQRLDVWLKKF